MALQRCCIAIKETLEQLSIHCDSETSKVSNILASERNLRKDLCMTSLVRGEVTVDGKKISGAAQHLYQDSILQHGSISLYKSPALISKVMNTTSENQGAMNRKLQSESISLMEAGYHVNRADFSELFLSSIIRNLQLNVFYNNLNSREMKKAESFREQFEVISVTDYISATA